MYKRFFAFGCSFTEYRWATWADIVAYAYKDAEYYNFGKAGGSNQVILSRVMEADEQYHFNKDDLVIVQWTGPNRECRWLNGGWRGAGGNIYLFGSQFPKEFIDNWTHPLDFILKDMVAMKSVNTLLKASGCTYYNITMAPIRSPDYYPIKAPDKKDDIQLLIENYKQITSQIKTSISEIVFKNGDWLSKLPRPKSAFGPWENMKVKADSHPTTNEYLEYLKTEMPEITLPPDADAIADSITQTVLNQINHEKDLPLGSMFGERPAPIRARDTIFFYQRYKQVLPEQIAANVH